MKTYDGHVVIVTGAPGNLGSAVSKAYLKTGANLVLVDYKEDRLTERFPELASSEDHYLAASVDLTQPEAVEKMVHETMDRFGRIDAVVNTVGGFTMGEKVHEMDLETLEKMMRLNARTFLITSKAVVPHMIKAGKGKIVSIGARPSLEGKAKMGAYSVAKSAVLRLTEAMSSELKGQGINVNCVLPGTIDTPPNREAMPNADHSKWVQPASLADVILFLTSDAARDIHGAAIPVYGS
ncbi:MAG: SDR family NAD(P)-dependent oxidoreductase [Anaerolineales bacterium]